MKLNKNSSNNELERLPPMDDSKKYSSLIGN
jgi:hypothetical protein